MHFLLLTNSSLYVLKQSYCKRFQVWSYQPQEKKKTIIEQISSSFPRLIRIPLLSISQSQFPFFHHPLHSFFPGPFSEVTGWVMGVILCLPLPEFQFCSSSPCRCFICLCSGVVYSPSQDFPFCHAKSHLQAQQDAFSLSQNTFGVSHCPVNTLQLPKQLHSPYFLFLPWVYFILA